MTVRNPFVPRQVLLAVLVAGLVFSLSAVAGDKAVDNAKGAPPVMDEQTKQMMEMMEKLGAPGSQHVDLMKYSGKWKTTNKSWMSPGDPVVTNGISTYKPILGGRFLMEEYKGTFMDKPFEGFGITGYDNQKKEYVNIWMDNLGTMVMIARGNMDASGKVLTMNTEWEDPSGQKSLVRMVTTNQDPNTKIFEMFTTREGQEVKEMEITYARKK